MTKNTIYSPEDFARWLNDHLATSTDQSTVDLIPAPCGIGKSYSMTVQIAEALKTYNGGGILLVTDEVERMRSYVSDTEHSYLNEYIQRNKNRILVYEAANARTDRERLFDTPIIIMSTQRFFNLSREAVIDLTSSYIPRRHIFIDERAPLTEMIRVDLGTFNDIDTALDKCLDNTAREKPWIVDQWRNLRQRYDKYMKAYEQSHDDYEKTLWHIDEDNHATTDDTRFVHLIFDTYAAKLRHADNDILKKFKAILQLVTDGALFISRRKPNAKSTNEYCNFFVVCLDHSDLLLNVGSKTIILDGTGDLDSVYNAWYINRVDCSKFKRHLSKLTINIVDVNTSRNAIAKSPSTNKKLKAIVDFVRSLPKVDAVFTYGHGKPGEIESTNTVERVFHDAGFTTGHFGALKGSNRFRAMTDIVQVGLARLPEEYYLAMAIQSAANRYPPNAKHEIVANFKMAAKRIMIRHVLADMEQNLFRGAIRNVDSDKRQTFTVLYKAKPQLDKEGNDRNDLSELTQAIRERYEPMGATVNIFDTPTTVMRLKIQERKSKDGDKTPAQKLTEYLDLKQQSAGKPFKLSTLLEECGLNRTQYKNVLRRNAHIKKRLDEIRTDVQGWYKFPAPTL